MKLLLAVILALVFSVALFGQGAAPRLVTVTPDISKANADCATAGENLGKGAVKELYLTTGKDDIKVEIISQKDDQIQFKVPAAVKPGRYTLMVLTADSKMFIEQPVKLTIE
jgi:hypothetical protein